MKVFVQTGGAGQIVAMIEGFGSKYSVPSHEEQVEERQVHEEQGEGEKDAAEAAPAEESRVQQEEEAGPQERVSRGPEGESDAAAESGQHNDLKEIAGNFERPNVQHDASPAGTVAISASDFKRMHAAKAGGASASKKSSEAAETPEAHAARNAFFKTRWVAIKKQWESADIDTDKMHELHNFEKLTKNASFETIENIASLMAFMVAGKNNPAVQAVGTFVEVASRGLIKKRTAEKIIRTVPHILQAMAMSLDPDTRKMTEGGFRLALKPNPVEGDREAGEKGLEAREVRLIRDAVRRALRDNGFNPNTGELIDEDKKRSIERVRNEDIEMAAERRRQDFLEGPHVFSEKKDDWPV